MRGKSVLGVILGLVALGLLVFLVLNLMGVVTVWTSPDKDQVNITVDAGQMREGARRLVDETGEAVEKTGKEMQEEANDPKND